MDRKSTQKLRLDRRLIRRRGWIPGDELERELQGLPDVSEKGVTIGGEADRERRPPAGADGREPPAS